MIQLGEVVEHDLQLFFLVIDLITAQARYKSLFSSSDATLDANFSQSIGYDTPLLPAKSLSSNKERP
jgi:hypothetical protein